MCGFEIIRPNVNVCKENARNFSDSLRFPSLHLPTPLSDGVCLFVSLCIWVHISACPLSVCHAAHTSFYWQSYY